MSKKDTIRAFATSSKREEKLVTIGNDPDTKEDIQVLVIAPSVGQRGRMLKLANETKKGKPGEVEIDTAKLQVAAIVACCHDPETREQLFSDADTAVLMGQSAGGWLDSVFEVIQPWMGVGEKEAETKND